MASTDAWCRAAFAGARILRLGTVDSAGLPHLVPATFAVAADTVVIAVDHKPKRHTNLQRLRNISHNPAVTLLVDHYENDWDRLWWVRADGSAQVLTGERARRLITLLVAKYEQYQRLPPPGPVILVEVRRWSGWRASPGVKPA